MRNLHYFISIAVIIFKNMPKRTEVVPKSSQGRAIPCRGVNSIWPILCHNKAQSLRFMRRGFFTVVTSDFSVSGPKVEFSKNDPFIQLNKVYLYNLSILSS